MVKINAVKFLGGINRTYNFQYTKKTQYNMVTTHLTTATKIFFY